MKRIKNKIARVDLLRSTTRALINLLNIATDHLPPAVASAVRREIAARVMAEIIVTERTTETPEDVVKEIAAQVARVKRSRDRWVM